MIIEQRIDDIRFYIKNLEAQSTKLREALEKIKDYDKYNGSISGYSSNVTEIVEIAKQALEGK